MKRLSKSEAIARLQQAAVYYERTPSVRELSKFISHMVLYRLFGSYTNAVEAAGLLVTNHRPKRLPHSRHSARKAYIREAVFNERGKRCEVCCGKSRVAIHHIVPYSITRDNDLRNLRVLCAKCHGKEGQKVIRYGMRLVYAKAIAQLPKKPYPWWTPENDPLLPGPLHESLFPVKED